MTNLMLKPRFAFDFDPFFRNLFDTIDGSTAPSARTWYPAMDLVDENDKLVLHVEVPGLDAKDVQVSLQDDVITVRGERKSETERKGKVLKREQLYGAFTRTVELPYRVQSDKVKAQYKNGVMIITLPKAEEHVGRTIPVEIES